MIQGNLALSAGTQFFSDYFTVDQGFLKIIGILLYKQLQIAGYMGGSLDLDKTILLDIKTADKLDDKLAGSLLVKRENKLDKKLSKKTRDILVSKADQARVFCYAPYSNYKVGCAVLLADSSIITGVNIENASYPVTLCAERSAMASVISQGLQDKIQAVAIITKSNPPGSPCGMCRQFLAEFLDPKTPIILANDLGQQVVTNISELLPKAFGPRALA